MDSAMMVLTVLYLLVMSILKTVVTVMVQTIQMYLKHVLILMMVAIL